VPGHSAIALLPLAAAPAAERRARVVTSDAWNGLWQARLSPDDRWIAFVAAPRTGTSIATVYVVRRSGGEWIQVTPGIDWEDKPRWAPDGRTIYFVSLRGGELNLWGIRFDPTQCRLLVEAFPVTAYTGTTRILANISDMEIGIARDSLVLSIVDSVGGIWMLEDVDR